jgi:hypothetical protein
MLWAFQIVISFIAGFSERWVSDLLTRTAGLLAGNSNPIAGGAAPPAATQKTATAADEKNPLGKAPAPPAAPAPAAATDDAVG